MPRFGKRSLKRLEGVDPKLLSVLKKVVKYFDITIIEGLRSSSRQEELLAEGKTKLKFGKHCEGKAVDIAPYPIDWDARDDFHYLGGFVLGIAAGMGINIRWGGDWNGSSLDEEARTTKDNNFDDLVHFEIRE
tara:strand:+ start:353 stop:751 length:399 start_codon:yes stop_codon:yes gene_type:complete